MKSNWLINVPPDTESLKLFETFGIDKTIGSILFSRGIKRRDEIKAFLYPELNDLHSPFLMKGIHDAVIRIKKALSGNERIAIFADSDLDGITSLSILYDLLSKCGTVPEIRYPRNKEGYGLTCDIIDEFVSSGITLLITVDSGIRDIEEIKYAADRGMETIVTDHHEPDSVYPEAIIINPKMPGCPYPYKELAGVGVALKLAHALLFSYTAGFDKKFILVDSYENKILFHTLFNGVVIDSHQTDSSSSTMILKEHFLSDNYIVCTESLSDKLNEIICENKLNAKFDTILNLSNKITKKKHSSEQEMLSELLKKFRIYHTFYSREQVVIKLFLELQMRSSRKSLERMQSYIALATVGTIADIMPLNGENRNIIKYGLEVLKNKKGHHGIRALLNNSEPSAKSITWDVAPLLNTPGRLGETGLTVDFFLRNDIEDNSSIIREIEKLNRERKKTVTSITEMIKEKIALEPEICTNKIFYYYGPEIMSGLAGLIASRIADELKKPVIIAVDEHGTDMVKGSGRSYNDFNFFRFVEPLSEMFERIGGHAQAFGFTAKKEKIQEIISAINKAISNVVGDNYVSDENVKIDALIGINEINSTLIDKLSILEPFGKKNEEPVFVSQKVIIESYSPFGSSGNHGKYILSNSLHAIGWNMSEKMEQYMQHGSPVDIIYHLENNIFNNKKYPRLKLIDIDIS